MSGSWADWPPARPIRVDGGIKARSKRGAIGEQWWSRRFISVLESYGMSGRLARGRSYARAGQVLDFELSQGKVTARVQGYQPQELAVVELGEPDLVRPLEELPRELLLLFQHGVDALLHRTPAHELVHQHPAGLADPEGPVGGLVLHGRVPPTVEVNDMGRGGSSACWSRTA